LHTPVWYLSRGACCVLLTFLVVPARIAACFAALMVLGACGGTPGSATTSSTALGPNVYQRECAVCHGQNLEGLGSAPGLVGVVDRLGRGEVERIVEQGRATMLPVELGDAELTALVDWLATR